MPTNGVSIKPRKLIFLQGVESNHVIITIIIIIVIIIIYWNEVPQAQGAGVSKFATLPLKTELWS